MWKRFEKLFKIPIEAHLHLSEGWLRSFKSRTGLLSIKLHGEANSAAPESVATEKARVRTIINFYEPVNIYNMEQTGLFNG